MEENKEGDKFIVNLKSNTSNNQTSLNYHEQGSSFGMNNQEGQEVTNEEQDEVYALYRDGYEKSNSVPRSYTEESNIAS